MWSEADEDVKPRPSVEEHEADLRRAWVVTPGALLQGRCIEHRIRGCRCGMTSPGPHGAGAGRAVADEGEGARATVEDAREGHPGPVPDTVVVGLGVVPGPARGDELHDWTADPYHDAYRCKACGQVCYAALPPDGPCTCAPSRWVPLGASEPEPAVCLADTMPRENEEA